VSATIRFLLPQIHTMSTGKTVTTDRGKNYARRELYATTATAVLLSAGLLSVHLPGSFSQDSLFMLNEALNTRIGNFEEWYSPAYALIWKAMISALAAIHLSPFVQVSSMCVLQTLLIVGSLVYLLYVHTKTWKVAVGYAAAIIISPAVLVYFGEIWRDVLMAAFLLLAVCFLDCFRRTGSRAMAVAALFVLFLASLIRQNAFIAELPLFLWTGLIWHRGSPRQFIRALASTGALIVIFAVLWSVTTSGLAATNYGRGASSIMYYDLMGISARTGEMLIPGNLTAPEYSLDTVRARYQSEYNDLTGFILPSNPQQMRAVALAWRGAVLAHPKRYLQHRWAVTLRFLGISDVPHLPYSYGIPESLYPNYIANTAYYLKFPVTPARAIVADWLSVATYWAFRPWFYGVLAMGIMIVERRKRGTAFWLCASGWIYWLSCFISVPSTDFRYSWWNVLGATTALGLILAELSVEKWSKRQSQP
jgi:hypothetical protein